MSIHSALEFIDRIRQDSAFRKSGYTANSPAEFAHGIATAGFTFTHAEIDDAFRNLLLKAKDEECAAEIRELKNWYALLARPPKDPKSCSTCGLKSDCGGSCPE